MSIRSFDFNNVSVRDYMARDYIETDLVFI